MRVFKTEFASYNWCVELALTHPWDWHPLLEQWLDKRDSNGRRLYMSWVDMETRFVYLAFDNEREACRFATYAALLDIER